MAASIIQNWWKRKYYEKTSMTYRLISMKESENENRINPYTSRINKR